MHTSKIPSKIPYTHLFLRDSVSTAIQADGHILVVNSPTGHIVTTSREDDAIKEKVSKSGLVACAASSRDGKHLVTVTDDKVIRTWEVGLDQLTLLSERENPKKATDVKLAEDDTQILVATKFGDIFSYPLHASTNLPSQEKSDGSQGKSSKRPSDAKLLLGHVSLLTTFLLSPDERYVISADRDEHIRVSWYPESHVIEAFCLGQKKFVSALHIPTWDSSSLVSGGGDPVIKIWDWVNGRLRQQLLVENVVRPFIKVKVLRERGWGGESEGEGEDGQKLSSRKKRKAEKKKRKQNAEGAHDEKASENQDSMDVDNQEAGPSESKAEPQHDLPPLQPVLAIQRISSFTVNESHYLVFSATSASALFYCRYPEESGEGKTIENHEIKHIDFGQPVLDFILVPANSEILVLVDSQMSDDEGHITDCSRVRVVSYANAELSIPERSSKQELIDSLNSYESDSASYAGLYRALYILPKLVDSEEGQEGAAGSEVGSEQGRKLSQKELGRLKSKIARSKVMQKLQSAKSEEPEEKRVRAEES